MERLYHDKVFATLATHVQPALLLRWDSPKCRVDFPHRKGQTTEFAAFGFFCALEPHGASPGWRSCGRRLVQKSFAMIQHRVSYTMDSTLETVDSAEQSASRIAAEAGFDEDEVMRISMAVREAAVNAVLHGNAYDPDKKVILDFETIGNDLIITIRDQGAGLDLNKLPDPLSPENLLKTSGRGIFLIRSFMDEVLIQPSQTGTEIKLIKHVPGPSADVKEASQ
jgi:serine/threonine-protein kinase RsbW